MQPGSHRLNRHYTHALRLYLPVDLSIYYEFLACHFDTLQTSVVTFLKKSILPLVMSMPCSLL